MRRHLHQLYRDERGMSFVWVAMGMMSFMAATTLAIDVGMFMTARSQTQNAADAGALSGAVALVQNDFNDRSATGPAVLSAINTAQANKVIGATPSVVPADVTFPVGPTGQSNRVQVFAHRTAMSTIMGVLFGVKTVDVNAVAVAEASPANAMTCVKPFMIPDKWKEVGTPPWDTGDTFDMYDSKDNLLPVSKRDVYVPADQPGYTGYTVARDKGTPLVLRAGTGSNINPSFYYSWKMPGDVGGDFYRENIANCNQAVMHWKDLIVQEPGDKSGPTIQGIEALIAKDPSARWDGTCNCVKGSNFNTSPRVFPIPLYDPDYYSTGKVNGRPADFRIANFLGFFADHVSGNQIYGVITNVTGLVDPNAGPAPENAFPTAIRLVQ
jgi:Flp pilus assembly protein TadG